MATLPQIDRLLRHPRLEAAAGEFRREILLGVCRQLVAALRAAHQKDGAEIPDEEAVVEKVLEGLGHLRRRGLARVINGTGVVLNTNLGRAPLENDALVRLQAVVTGYSNLELDLESGKRGKRSSRLSELLRILTGCQAALVVNNNAAAVLLAVNCLARGAEVIVSRGELVEIGGSFRLPDVIESAGAILKEVGTTNRTRISDYERAIGPDTGLLLKCHRSNFEVRGFTEEASLEELIALGERRNVPLVKDLGSGVLCDVKQLGLEAEPTVQEVVSAGCDLVTFSGDKLLGGPQSGVIVGRAALVERLAKHPLYRALRVDKITIALLEETLSAYLQPDPAARLPALRLIALSADEIKGRVDSFVETANDLLGRITCRAVPSKSTVGGGSVPGQQKDSWALALSGPVKASYLVRMLRDCATPVIAVVQDETVRLDFRTVFPEEEGELLQLLQSVDGALARTSESTRSGDQQPAPSPGAFV